MQVRSETTPRASRDTQVILTGFTRKVLSWRLSNTMHAP